jgi:PucR family transcriptional regulator, purine catabolism regulatory protein
MLTIREILRMPCFAKAEVVAGHEGLNRRVRWVHIVDLPDPTFDWAKGNELLLTSGQGLGNDPGKQETYIPRLVAKGLSGMVLSLGYPLEQTPSLLIEAANRLAFPIIEVPPEINFIDITQQIFKAIINRQYSLQEQASDIHRRLTQVVLEGGDLQRLTETLASIIDRSVSLETPAFEVLAHASQGPIDEARARVIKTGRTSAEVATALLDHGLYQRLMHELRPIKVEPIPELGMTMERIVAPIVVDRAIYGYVWILAGERPLTELDELAIEQAATISALIMFKDRAVREAEETQQGDFMQQLLSGHPNLQTLSEQAHWLGLQLDKPHRILVVMGRSKAGGTVEQLASSLENWIRRRKVRALLVVREAGVVIIEEVDNLAASSPAAQKLVEDLNHPAYPLLIGVGRAYESLRDLHDSYAEALEAARIGRALGQTNGLINFADLGVLHWLYHLPADRIRENQYAASIRALVEHDALHQTDLVSTLATYLDHGGALGPAAEALAIHRNTLLYRQRRIEEISGLSLKDPITRLNLHVAVKSHQLHDE